MKYVIYVIALGLIITGIFMSGWISWVIFILGIILSNVPRALAEYEASNETDKTILCLLFIASNADGKQTATEQEYISKFIKKRHFTKKQINEIAANAADPSKWRFSTDEAEKMRIIDEIVGLIKADGVVSKKEKNFLELVADTINFDKEKALAKL